MTMPTPDECRRRADEVEHMARQAHDADAACVFDDLAKSWRALADILKKNPSDEYKDWTKFRKHPA
jgi:hypothetical protein